jgi:hypothetical protein
MECIEIRDWECQLVRANGAPHCVLLPLRALGSPVEIDPFSLFQARVHDDDLSFRSNAGKVILKGCPEDVRHMLLNEVPLFVEVEPDRGVVLFASQDKADLAPGEDLDREVSVREITAFRRTAGVSELIPPVLAAVSLQYAMIIPTVYSFDHLFSARPVIEGSVATALLGMTGIALGHMIKPVHLRAAQASFAIGITSIFSPVLISVGSISASYLMQLVFMGSVFGFGLAAALRLAAVTLPSPSPAMLFIRNGRYRPEGKPEVFSRWWPFRARRSIRPALP